MKQETIKIQLLNDTHICVKAVLPDGTPIDLSDFSLKEVRLGIHGHEIKPMEDATIKDGYICIPISATMPLGVYDVHILGSFGQFQAEREVSDNRYAMFELVKYGNGISYDRYYTEMVVIGLPDSEVERLRRELEKKIAEAEAKRAYWEQQALNLDGVAKQGSNTAATNTAIYDLIYHGGGGGGGGGLTPEQWDKIAKEETSQKILAAVSLTAAQADEDWKNVQPA